MNKIIIAVAPIGPWGQSDDNPLAPNDLACEMQACVEEGASVVHLHARDKTGNLTTDLSVFDESVESIKSRCDIILEASTGGLSDLSAVQRGLTLTNPHAEAGSLNLGSLNFGDEVYRNSVPDVCKWIDEMSIRGVKPSLEVFDTGQVAFARHLLSQGLLTPPCNFSFIFNVQWGMPYSAGLLEALKGMLPEESIFGCIFVANVDFAQHLESAGLGASVLRVGFEDSPSFEGGRATSNVDLVRGIRILLEKAGYQIAGVPEARGILGTEER
jgi:3-keto-5-aminohexanoate cleavage enzyme